MRPEPGRVDLRFAAWSGNRLPLAADDDVAEDEDHEHGTTVRARLGGDAITTHRVAFAEHPDDGGALRCATHPSVDRPGAHRRG